MIRKLFVISIAFLFLAGLASPVLLVQPVLAQTSEAGWAAPVNLSRTGATRDPSLIMDNAGVFHAVWQDNFAGTISTQNDGSGWSTPRVVKFPFDTFTPRFVKDARGYVAAFWLDADRSLLSSFVAATQFEIPDAWNAVQTLGESVLDYDAVVDANGQPHVVFLRTQTEESFEGGIFYRKSGGIGFTWENPTSLNTSSYFRALEDGGGHVRLAATQSEEATLLYATWDNRTLKRIYLSRSLDGGKNWQATQIIDGPSDIAPTADPFRIVVHARGEVVDLVWDSGLQSGFDCTQYYQHSVDRGETWGVRQAMLSDQVGCPDANQFFDSPDNLTILMTTIQGEVFLMAWDGKMWSQPQAQSILFNFLDVDNYDTVNFRCRQASLVNGEDFYVIGCDTVGDGDIWLLSRKLGNVDDWFPPPNIWSEPVVVATDRPVISGLETLADSSGRLHIFWNQPDPNEPSRTGVYYARLDEDGWHPPVRVFSSPDNRAGRPSVTVDANGRLAAVWASASSGELYYSWADPAVANNPFEWVDPIPLPILQKAVVDPVIKSDLPGGVLFVVYAIQLNEDRGIYTVSSTDSGQSWSNPVQVFDARQAGWSMVQKPKIEIGPDGSLSVIWERGSLPGDVGVMGLYASRSIDGGTSWSPAELVVEAAISWSEISLEAQKNVYRFWESEENGTSGLFYEASTDSGESYSPIENLTRLDEILGPASVAEDPQGGLHLVQILERENEHKVVLNHWEAADLTWRVSTGIELKDTQLNNVLDVAASVVDGNRLAVVYIYADAPTESAPGKMSILYTSRGLDASTEAKPMPTAMAQELPVQPASTLQSSTAVAEATPPPEITAPTVETPTSPVSASGGGTQSPPAGGLVLPGGAWGGLALGTGVAVAIVAITFGLALRRTRRTAR